MESEQTIFFTMNSQTDLQLIFGVRLKGSICINTLWTAQTALYSPVKHFVELDFQEEVSLETRSSNKFDKKALFILFRKWALLIHIPTISDDAKRICRTIIAIP